MEILSKTFCVFYMITMYLTWNQQSFSLAQEYIKSSCDAPVVYLGDPANITCHFSVNLRERVKPFRIYRKPFRDGMEDTVLDCHWREKDRLTCEKTPPGYKFNNEVSEQVTFTVLETSLDKMGYYECRAEPSYPQGIQRCSLVADDKPDVPPATRDDDGDNSGFALGSVVGAAVTVVIVLLLGGVLFLCRRRVRKCLPWFSSRSEEQTVQNISMKEGQTPKTKRVPCGEPSGTEGGHADIFPSAAPGKRLRLLIIGKTGTGKSTVANNILGQAAFNVGKGMTPITTQVSERSSDAFQVVDTPDFQGLSEEDKTREIAHLKELLDVPPHAVLLAVRCDEFTEKEFKNYCMTTELLGNCFLPQRLVIVFTFGNRDTNIEQMKKNNPTLRKVMEAAGERYVIFSKNASDDERRELVDIVKTVA